MASVCQEELVRSVNAATPRRRPGSPGLGPGPCSAHVTTKSPGLTLSCKDTSEQARAQAGTLSRRGLAVPRGGSSRQARPRLLLPALPRPPGVPAAGAEAVKPRLLDTALPLPRICAKETIRRVSQGAGHSRGHRSKTKANTGRPTPSRGGASHREGTAGDAGQRSTHKPEPHVPAGECVH